MSLHLDLVPAPTSPRLTISGSALEFPVRRVWCVARNYAAHAIETGAPVAEPFFFTKFAETVLPQPSSVPYPPQTTALHHEVELMLALGDGGHNLTVEAASACIVAAGVAVDLTRRDAQTTAKQQGRPWALAKGFDHATPCGQLIQTNGPIPEAAELQLWVDGVLQQRSTVQAMLRAQAELIADLSRHVTLAAGDLILTGTPAGVGPLLPGQEVRARIDGLPELHFVVGTPGSEATSSGDITAEMVLDMWFGAPGTPVAERFPTWFAKDPAFDADLRTRFSHTLQRAARGELDQWSHTPRGRLALIILLDQLSRNIYRDTPAAFSQDTRARRLTVEGMALGHDQAVTAVEAMFMYLPLEHGESAFWQTQSIAAYTALQARADAGTEAVLTTFLLYATKHHDTIAEFGRYPHRNRILGRTDTAEERVYLAGDDAGF